MGILVIERSPYTLLFRVAMQTLRLHRKFVYLEWQIIIHVIEL